jgi:hypothetical protein
MQLSQSVYAPTAWRRLLWLALLVLASVAFTLGFACAVPLAAFAAAAALTLSLADALALILLVWLANQLVGFGVLGYPWTLSTFAWGIALGVIAVAATLVSHWTAGRLGEATRVFKLAATFLAAFALYEALLLLVSAALLGGMEVFTGEIQGRILAINGAAFIGLLALNRVAISVGLVAERPVRISMTERHA